MSVDSIIIIIRDPNNNDMLFITLVSIVLFPPNILFQQVAWISKILAWVLPESLQKVISTVGVLCRSNSLYLNCKMVGALGASNFDRQHELKSAACVQRPSSRWCPVVICGHYLAPSRGFPIIASVR